jgi:hypothetical protein
MTEPVVLNKLDVARAAAKAYREGRLSAQGPTPRCSYRDDSGYPCVIGAAIDDNTAALWDMQGVNLGNGVSALHRERFLATDDEDALVYLQMAHDDWASRMEDDAEPRLISLLNSILPADEQITQ